MSQFVYVLEVKKPKKEGGSTILRVQNGPKREDQNREVEFVNILMIRAPKHLDLTGIEPGKYANVVVREQGVATRKPDGKVFYTPELVAQAIKPAQPWQLNDAADLYPVAE
ncbi:hypothetical protein [Alteromonas macleodii]|uniref:hypothetical protein n=1 Tax=Alteromonas macleodii TaxID=28108 RepID=UPI0031409652|tara:strand:- start:86701 stop:87033 length:333 start_codon:yes stop_codon:yes gene_type:complete